MGDIFDFFTKVTDTASSVASGAANTYSAVTKALNPGGTAQPQQQPQQIIVQQPAVAPMSTGVKVALGLAGAGLIGGVIYAVTKKK